MEKQMAQLPGAGSRGPQTPAYLYMIRHGKPDQLDMNGYYGQMDVELSEEGREQSRRLAERLSSVPFDAVYSSDLKRASELAAMLAEPRGLPVRQAAVFRERCMGVLQGIPRERLESEHADLYNRWRTDRVRFRVPEAENFLDLHERIVPAVLELAGSFAGRRVALVCHAGPIRVTVAHILGMPLDNIFRIEINYCGVFVLEFAPGEQARVTLMNG
jgi:broad specificity phosphatase PhoE